METKGTPDSSPPQQVPENITPHMIVYTDEMFYGPYLEILVQPQDTFRFRYLTEAGTHGCLQGRDRDQPKTYPTVELKNYSGQAVIKCKIYQIDKDEEHPHSLQVDNSDEVPSALVPDDGSYMVCFQGLGVIQPLKKIVPSILYQKFKKSMTKEAYRTVNKKELRVECKKRADGINLNKIRLRFSAHHSDTDKMICEPVFSEPINNAKNPDTNELKICCASHSSGLAEGRELLILLVEKVRTRNIQVRFFEINSQGERIWEAPVHIMDADVHHQYAIKILSPCYREPATAKHVQVFIELVRPSDGRRSEPIPYTYRARPIHQLQKRKRGSAASSDVASPASSIVSSVSNTSTRSIITPKIPIKKEENIIIQTTIPMAFQFDESNVFGSAIQSENNHLQIPQGTNSGGFGAELPTAFSMPMKECSNGPREEVFEFFVNPSDSSSEVWNLGNCNPEFNLMNSKNPVLSQVNAPTPLAMAMTTDEQNCSFINDVGPPEEVQAFQDEKEMLEMYFDSCFSSDGGSHPTRNKKEKVKNQVYFTTKEGEEMKKLVKEICQLVHDKPNNHKKQIRILLERIFEIRLSNGDTFLHMTLTNHLKSFKVVVNIIDAVDMNHLLNAGNHEMQTILHVAIINDMPDIVAYLIEKGCDPMRADSEGNTAFHLAVMCGSLGALLQAARNKGCEYDIDTVNKKWQTPLHVSAVYGRAASARLLLETGAGRLAADGRGRTPLHTAVINTHVELVATLLEFASTREVNMADSKCMTALQIACAGDACRTTVQIIQLLLEHGADPMVCAGDSKPAWRLARGKAPMWEVVKRYIPKDIPEDISQDSSEDTSDESSGLYSESDDEFQSADEGDYEAGDITKRLESVQLDDRAAKVQD